MDSFNRVFVILVATIGVVVSRGIAVSLIWNMFVPKFFGLPTLPTLLAIALSTLLSVLMPTVAPRRDSAVSEEKNYKDLYNLLIISFIAPWVGYLIALATTGLYY